MTPELLELETLVAMLRISTCEVNIFFFFFLFQFQQISIDFTFFFVTS